MVIDIAILSLLNSIIFVQLFAEYSIIYFTWDVKGTLSNFCNKAKK